MDTKGLGRSASPSGYSAEPEPCSTVSAVPVSIPNAETKLTERLRDRLGGIEVKQFGGDNFAVFLCSNLEDADDDGEEGDCGWRPSAIEGYEAVIKAVHAHYAPTIWQLQADLASAIEARRAETAETGAVHESAVGNAETPKPSRGTDHG